MLPQQLKKAVADNPKKVANLIDIVNLPTVLRDFMGQSQSSQLACFKRVWCYIRDNNLQVSFSSHSSLPNFYDISYSSDMFLNLLCHDRGMDA